VFFDLTPGEMGSIHPPVGVNKSSPLGPPPLRKEGERLQEGAFAPSLLYSPLQPEITLAFYIIQAGEGSGVRQSFLRRTIICQQNPGKHYLTKDR
jgi:hypothetical protein